MLVLGIETSCDETAVGIVEDRFTVRSNVIASQIELHAPYGGVVPEVAARAHLELLQPTLDRALAEAGCRLDDIDAVAVTAGPGLVGALLVGVSAAKGLALARDLPLLGVNHLRAHVEAAQLEYGELDPPILALVVSGGHTSLVAMDAVGTDEGDGGDAGGGEGHATGHGPPAAGFRHLGSTIDDAAGEAFDKIARFLGLGYPGGPEIDRLARQGDPAAIDFPRALANDDTYDFSLSGLKTSVVRYLRRLEAAGEEPDLPDVAASFQEAIVDVQVDKTMRAAAAEGIGQVVIAGGVAANTRLRERMQAACDEHGLRLLVPHIALCTDNGAMVAASGGNLLARGVLSTLDLEVDPNLPLADAHAGATGGGSGPRRGGGPGRAGP